MNLFELFVKIGVDDQASGKLSDLSSKLGNGLKTAAKIGTAAVGAAAAGITALTTAAVNNYAEYEQLVGGVETLFGTKGAKTVEEYAKLVGQSVDYVSAEFEMLQAAQKTAMDNAANAYKTAGMSANEYMQTITGFAAALKQSTASELEAAEIGDMAVQDMADNANKMGTSMEAIQNAYAGFAKQNYTMLDNLKLGYGGTKTEMERLLEDAEALSGIEYDIDNLADVYNAIHVIQKEMGITGTTALEAGRTISGSVGAMKSAWTNLVTGIADGNADISKLVDDLVTTIAGDGTESNLGVIGNILPAIQTALKGAGDLIANLAPVAVDAISGLISDVLPNILESGAMLVSAIGEGIVSNADMLIQTAFDVILMLADGLISGVDGLSNGAISIVESLAMWVVEYSYILIQKATVLITEFANGIVESLPALATAAVEIISSLASEVERNFPELIKTASNAIMWIVDTLTDEKSLGSLLDSALVIIMALVDGMVEFIPKLIDAAILLIEKLVVFLLDPKNIKKLADAAAKIVVALANGLIKSVGTFIGSVGTLISRVTDKFKQNDWGQIGKDVVNGIWEGLKGVWKKLEIWFTEQWNNLVGGVKELLGIHSPSRVFAGIGENMALGLGEGWDNEFGSIRRGINGSLNFSTGTIDYGSSAFGVGAYKMTRGMQDNSGVFGGNATIVVQSVLDGKVIGETAYQYSKNKGRMYGMA